MSLFSDLPGQAGRQLPAGVLRVNVTSLKLIQSEKGALYVTMEYTLPDFNAKRKHNFLLPKVWGPTPEELEQFQKRARKFIKVLFFQLLKNFIYIDQSTYKEYIQMLSDRIDALDFYSAEELAEYLNSEVLSAVKINPEKDFMGYFYYAEDKRSGETVKVHTLYVPVWSSDPSKVQAKWMYWPVLNYKAYSQEHLNSIPLAFQTIETHASVVDGISTVPSEVGGTPKAEEIQEATTTHEEDAPDPDGAEGSEEEYPQTWG